MTAFTPEQEEYIRQIVREEIHKHLALMARVPLVELGQRLVKTEQIVGDGVRMLQRLTRELLKED